MIITISREYGAGGHSIGKSVAKELGIEFYDRDIIRATVKESGVDMPDVERVEEELTRSQIFWRAISPNGYIDLQDNIRAIEEAIESFGDEYLGRKNGRNTIRLWQLERCKYALTFPLGYQLEAPISLMWELDGQGLQPRGWFPSHRLKTQGVWTMLTVANSGATDAVTDNGCCYEDECDFRLRIHPKLHLAYQPRPNIMNDNPEKLEDFT